MPKSNPGRDMKRDEIIVKGIKEVVRRTTTVGRKCDSCKKSISPGSIYFRVKYKSAKKPMEMFHEGCFEYEFTNK